MAGQPLAPRQVLLWHAAEGVTDEHYVDTKLIDLRGVLDLLPAFLLDGWPERQAQRATGTDNETADRDYLPSDTRPGPRQLRRETERTSAESAPAASAATVPCDSRTRVFSARVPPRSQSGADGEQKRRGRFRNQRDVVEARRFHLAHGELAR